MTEQMYWETSENLLPVVQSLNCTSESLMIFERVPRTFLSDDEGQDGICLRKYDPSENFEAWERGRIFHNNFELRWENQGEIFVIVYIGVRKKLPMSHTKFLSEFEVHDESYYLWGERMTADARKLLDQPVKTNLFLELQIPRLLHYPVSNQDKKSRVKLSVRHYLNLETGTLEFYRFRHLEEV